MPRLPLNLGECENDKNAESVISALRKINAMTAELFDAYGLEDREVVDVSDDVGGFREVAIIRPSMLAFNANIVRLYGAAGLADPPPLVNAGTRPYSGDADMVRDAFLKVDAAFAALYERLSLLTER